jgi:hypothetical protein
MKADGDDSSGSVSPAGQITVDSGVMNPALLVAGFDEDTKKLWRRTKLKPRIKRSCSGYWRCPSII